MYRIVSDEIFGKAESACIVSLQQPHTVPLCRGKKWLRVAIVMATRMVTVTVMGTVASCEMLATCKRS
jgi:hypothetical protein